MKNTRGQIFTFDLLVATAIFLVILLITNWAWSTSAEKMATIERRSDIETISRSALAALVDTEGIPANWSKLSASSFDESTVQMLGLASSQSKSLGDSTQRVRTSALGLQGVSTLERTKIAALKTLEGTRYDTIKNILGIRGPQYEFHLQVSEWNGTGFASTTSVGLIPGSNASQVVRLDRFALINDTRAQLTLKVWQACREKTC